jgi:hypothetical protein
LGKIWRGGVGKDGMKLPYTEIRLLERKELDRNRNNSDRN